MTDSESGRRRFLGCFTNLLMGLVGLAVVIPGLAYFLGPLRKRAGAEGASFQDVGPLSDIPIGRWHLLTLETVQEDGWKKTRTRHAIWVRRNEEGNQEPTVLSSICPHLGCPINWHEGEGRFRCPCHAAVFDGAGRHTSGPPPRSMDPLEFEVRAGRLWVRWQDFKIGVAQRVPVSV